MVPAANPETVYDIKYWRKSCEFATQRVVQLDMLQLSDGVASFALNHHMLIPSCCNMRSTG